MPNAERISSFPQSELRRRKRQNVSAVEAAAWLDSAGILKDSLDRPGKPLRQFLRRGRIRGQRQEPNGRWFIDRVGAAAQLSPTPSAILSADQTVSMLKARTRREAAAQEFKPTEVKLLLVAEAPPKSLDRYFYYIDVKSHDSLFRYVATQLLGVGPSRQNKRELLRSTKDRGAFLIDLSEDPIDGESLDRHVPSLIHRCSALSPKHIILIKATVYDSAFDALAENGLPVVNERIPFPGSGQQRKFEVAFRRALTKIGWRSGRKATR